MTTNLMLPYYLRRNLWAFARELDVVTTDQHSAMLPHAGPDSRVFRGVTQPGVAVAGLDEPDAMRALEADGLLTNHTTDTGPLLPEPAHGLLTGRAALELPPGGRVVPRGH